MSDYTPVEGQKGLYRDNNTTAIINKDQSGYKSYIARKESMFILLNPGVLAKD